MSEQKQYTPSHQEEDTVRELTDKEIAGAVGKAATDAEIDAVLDTIDDVLATNAEEFVRNFIQKGGQ